jgi:hypothetical protein
MQLCKFGAVGALGAALALPAMAQTGNQGMWQGQGGGPSGFNQGMNQGLNGPGNYGGGSGQNSPGGSNGSNRFWEGGGRAPGSSAPQGQNFGANAYGQGGPGNQGGFPHHHLVAREVHELRLALEQAGFRNVHILPQSFLVRAEDQQGRRVLMIIDPTGFTEVTQLDTGSGGHRGSAMQGGGGGSGAMQQQGGMPSGGWSSGVTNPAFGQSGRNDMGHYR